MALIQMTDLPAFAQLKQEGWKIKGAARRSDQKFIRVLLLNLMPLKEQTEVQLLRRLASSSIWVEPVFLTTESYQSTHVDPHHLETYYHTFREIQDQKWDGLMITGAPIEHLEFEEVRYWRELAQIMEWSKTQVRSVFHICWGAQAGLYYHYGVSKKALAEKQFGIYSHDIIQESPLVHNMEAPFPAPHSRHTYTPKEEILQVPGLKLVCESPMAGVYLMVNETSRDIFVTGHSEYDANTLRTEYQRDLAKGLPIQKPYHYFPGDDDTKQPVCTWEQHSETLFHNWLSYYASAF